MPRQSVRPTVPAGLVFTPSSRSGSTASPLTRSSTTWPPSCLTATLIDGSDGEKSVRGCSHSYPGSAAATHFSS